MTSKNTYGFTVLELVVAVVLTGIVAAIAFIN
jgi:prepilin-type N-terminal cleavage/methylation domain-containing protein